MLIGRLRGILNSTHRELSMRISPPINKTWYEFRAVSRYVQCDSGQWMNTNLVYIQTFSSVVRHVQGRSLSGVRQYKQCDNKARTYLQKRITEVLLVVVNIPNLGLEVLSLLLVTELADVASSLPCLATIARRAHRRMMPDRL